jgi:uncharacterized protein (DUF302 family)
MEIDGLITLKSHLGPEETMNRFEAAARGAGLEVFAHVDHAAGAARVGLALRPTELLVFGSPRAGTPLIQAAQTAGIDLPLKVLVWLDAAGTTWLSYNAPRWIAGRHGIGGGPEVAAMAARLDALARVATGRP